MLLSLAEYVCVCAQREKRECKEFVKLRSDVAMCNWTARCHRPPPDHSSEHVFILHQHPSHDADGLFSSVHWCVPTPLHQPHHLGSASSTLINRSFIFFVFPVSSSFFITVLGLFLGIFGASPPFFYLYERMFQTYHMHFISSISMSISASRWACDDVTTGERCLGLQVATASL